MKVILFMPWNLVRALYTPHQIGDHGSDHIEMKSSENA